MFEFDGKQFRNLEEQVLKNQEDITGILASELTLASFGIKVVGKVTSSSQLPDPISYTGDYGDAYAVTGSSDEPPYDYYVYTRPLSPYDSNRWFNIGKFPAPGPKGDTGATGATGPAGRGSLWYFGDTNPTSYTISNPKNNDVYLNKITGQYFVYENAWVYKATIVGQQGNTGPQGADGKSAYESAVDSGYEGSEEDFAEGLIYAVGVQNLIPTEAGSNNKLADKNFVNSSIATNTANYIAKTVGTTRVPFDSLDELEAYSGALSNNDYAFVKTTDGGNVLYTRYKYSAADEIWQEEYTLNNTSFTSAQWAAITSGISSEGVSQIATNTSAISAETTRATTAESNLSSTKQDAANLMHETWTFTTASGDVEKEVVLWISNQ